MTQLLTDLLAVRELLSVPERWTQKAFARDGAGTLVSAFDEKACCWCLQGAARRAVIAERRNCVIGALAAATDDKVGTLDENEDILTVFNDAPERAHAEVLAVIDKAIETERAAA